MRIGLGQFNCYLGDFQHNKSKILEFAQQAKDQGCDLLVFPELCLLGYHPCDLLERESIISEQMNALDEIVRLLPDDLYCLVGAATKNTGRGKPFFNSALLIKDGQILKTFNKELLPVYDVFDDSRHFSSGKIADNSFEMNGQTVQVLICEDMWGWDPLHETNPVEELDSEKIDLIVNLSASPFTINKRHNRLKYAQATSKQLQAPLVYVNMVGAQDELIYDGGSFALSAKGDLLVQNNHYQEHLNLIDYAQPSKAAVQSPQTDIDHLVSALVLGIRDYVRKTGFKKAHLGVSGGIDSAVVAALAAAAIGPDNIVGIALPTEFNANQSLSLAKDLAKNIGFKLHTLPIQEGYQQVVSDYEKCFGPKEFSLLHENFQARLRGLFLMGYSNENHSILLSTSNKSEFATGYSTLYGDMCGGLAPIGDLLKAQVYEVAKYFNQNSELIPSEIITRPPSAELRPDQKDSDSLPPYDELDGAVNKLVNQRGFAESETERWVLQRLFTSEFKRWQSPPILKVSDHAFGQGRRMPIAHKARS